MALGDPIIVGLEPGEFVLQEGAQFADNSNGGFDTGSRTFLTHPKTTPELWPQRGQADNLFDRWIRPRPTWSTMYVLEVAPRLDASGLLELAVSYRGAKGVKPAVITPGSRSTRLGTRAEGGSLVIPVPVPTARRVYVTTTKPTLSGVGLAVPPSEAGFLPAPPAYTFPGVIDRLIRNHLVGWVLENRTWPDLNIPAWEVTEEYTYYFELSPT